MRKVTGRVRDIQSNIRMTDEELSTIDYLADKLNMSRTDVIVYCTKLVRGVYEESDKQQGE